MHVDLGSPPKTLMSSCVFGCSPFLVEGTPTGLHPFPPGYLLRIFVRLSRPHVHGPGAAAVNLCAASLVCPGLLWGGTSVFRGWVGGSGRYPSQVKGKSKEGHRFGVPWFGPLLKGTEPLVGSTAKHAQDFVAAGGLVSLLPVLEQFTSLSVQDGGDVFCAVFFSGIFRGVFQGKALPKRQRIFALDA